MVTIDVTGRVANRPCIASFAHGQRAAVRWSTTSPAAGAQLPLESGRSYQREPRRRNINRARRKTRRLRANPIATIASMRALRREPNAERDATKPLCDQHAHQAIGGDCRHGFYDARAHEHGDLGGRRFHDGSYDDPCDGSAACACCPRSICNWPRPSISMRSPDCISNSRGSASADAAGA